MILIILLALAWLLAFLLLLGVLLRALRTGNREKEFSLLSPKMKAKMKDQTKTVQRDLPYFLKTPTKFKSCNIFLIYILPLIALLLLVTWPSYGITINFKNLIDQRLRVAGIRHTAEKLSKTRAHDIESYNKDLSLAAFQMTPLVIDKYLFASAGLQCRVMDSRVYPCKNETNTFVHIVVFEPYQLHKLPTKDATSYGSFTKETSCSNTDMVKWSFKNMRSKGVYYVEETGCVAAGTVANYTTNDVTDCRVYGDDAECMFGTIFNAHYSWAYGFYSVWLLLIYSTLLMTVYCAVPIWMNYGCCPCIKCKRVNYGSLEVGSRSVTKPISRSVEMGKPDGGGSGGTADGASTTAESKSNDI